MATAAKIIEQVEIPQPPIVKTETTGIDLALTLAEAQTLFDLIHCMVGAAGRGSHLLDIHVALRIAGIVSNPRCSNGTYDFALEARRAGVKYTFAPTEGVIRFS